jgi:hypothetical protein
MSWCDLVCSFLIVPWFWFINLDFFSDALNRPFLVASRTSSPTPSAGTIASQRSNGSANDSGSGSLHGSVSTAFQQTRTYPIWVGERWTRTRTRTPLRIWPMPPRHFQHSPLYHHHRCTHEHLRVQAQTRTAHRRSDQHYPNSPSIRHAALAMLTPELVTILNARGAAGELFETIDCVPPIDSTSADSPKPDPSSIKGE